MLRIHDTIAELFKCLRQEIAILFTLMMSAFSKCAVLQEHIPCAWTASALAAPSARARVRTRMLAAVARASSPGNTNFTHTYQSLCKRNTGSEHCCGMQMTVYTVYKYRELERWQPLAVETGVGCFVGRITSLVGQPTLGARLHRLELLISVLERENAYKCHHMIIWRQLDKRFSAVTWAC